MEEFNKSRTTPEELAKLKHARHLPPHIKGYVYRRFGFKSVEAMERLLEDFLTHFSVSEERANFKERANFNEAEIEVLGAIVYSECGKTFYDNLKEVDTEEYFLVHGPATTELNNLPNKTYVYLLITSPEHAHDLIDRYRKSVEDIPFNKKGVFCANLMRREFLESLDPNAKASEVEVVKGMATILAQLTDYYHGWVQCKKPDKYVHPGSEEAISREL